MNESGPFCYLNGDYLLLSEARIPVLDRGFIFGDAVYEVMIGTGGQVFALEEHLRRLERSLAAVRMPAPMTPDAWTVTLDQLMAHNGPEDCSIYVQVSRGAAPRDHRIPRDSQPTVFMMWQPHTFPRTLRHVAAVTAQDNRWQRCDIKTTSLLANVLLRDEAATHGAAEAILLRDGCLTEAAASNVFVVRDGAVATPPNGPGLLPGVTRNLLTGALKDVGLDVAESEISESALRSADEIWLTSTTRDISAVSTLDGAVVGPAGDYPLAERVFTAFGEYRARRMSVADANAAVE